MTDTTAYPNMIKPANIEWETDDTGHNVPVSGEFGDVYFSHADGLAESRHVFLDGNHLPERLANLAPYQHFTIAELGFGTGLNLLAVWQLWQKLRLVHTHLTTARLHFITTEKHPIPLADLTQILRLWAQRAPELSALIKALLSLYPPLIAGSHRLHFPNDNLTVDMWFGDAAASLAKLAINENDDRTARVDAWFLDGFAPSCNASLWADPIFAQVQRLSTIGTTAATYSCAGTVKRALMAAGFEIKKIKGFGRKREMLIARVTDDAETPSENHEHGLTRSKDYQNTVKNIVESQQQALIVGAGISGLMVAWSLANRGIEVTIVDKDAPLAGASGNPRALLAPKMTPIHHADEHLHTIGYLYSNRLYRALNTEALHIHSAPIFEPTGALDLLLKANIAVEQIADYPDDMATTLSNSEAQAISGIVTQDLSRHLYLPMSGLVNPRSLKEVVLNHPLISFERFNVATISETATRAYIEGYYGSDSDRIRISAENVVICAAYESHQLDRRIFDCRKIRGQLSWFTSSKEQLTHLPKIPLKYSGYCTLFTAKNENVVSGKVSESPPQFLLGASFIRNDASTDSRQNEHQISRDKLIAAIPALASVIAADTSTWQARAGVRTQTPDYHPIVGQLKHSKRLWTMTAMGAKGFAFAPICAEALADMMLGELAPLSLAMLARLSPNRIRLQTPLNDSSTSSNSSDDNN